MFASLRTFEFLVNKLLSYYVQVYFIFWLHFFVQKITVSNLCNYCWPRFCIIPLVKILLSNNGYSLLTSFKECYSFEARVLHVIDIHCLNSEYNVLQDPYFCGQDCYWHYVWDVTRYIRQDCGNIWVITMKLGRWWFVTRILNDRKWMQVKLL